MALFEASEKTFSGDMGGYHVAHEVKTGITQTAKPNLKREKQLIRGTAERTMCTRTGAEDPQAPTVTGAALDNAVTVTVHHQRG